MHVCLLFDGWRMCDVSFLLAPVLMIGRLEDMDIQTHGCKPWVLGNALVRYILIT